MMLSKYLLPTLKEKPAEAKIMSHQLMLRAAMIMQSAAGIYAWMPLGLRVLKKIETIIRDELEKIGFSELLLPILQSALLWKKSGRYYAYEDGKTLLTVKDRHDSELLFSPTAEEAICALFAQTISSYRSLPQKLYQIQWKFRDEVRPRYGVMRGREFLMKDAYSFDLSQELALITYAKMFRAYMAIFNRMGLVPVPVRANTGSIGGDYSHEVHVLAETGESVIFYDKNLLDNLSKNEDCWDLDKLNSFYAVEEEKHDVATCGVPISDLKKQKSIEVGHLFHLGTKYSSAMNVSVRTKEGDNIYPSMGCYGIGISRLVGAIIETNHDEKGIIWPATVAPFDLALVNLRPDDSKACNIVLSLYRELSHNRIDVLCDDTHESIGVKLHNMDLIGLPWQIILGERGINNGYIELKNRKTSEIQKVALNKIVDVCAKECICIKK